MAPLARPASSEGEENQNHMGKRAGVEFKESGEQGKWRPPGPDVVKTSNKEAPSRLPLEACVGATQIPAEFVIKDPTRLPTRGWGEEDASQLGIKGFVLPVIDMSPLMMTTMGVDCQHKPVDEECAKKVMAEIGRACEEWGFFQVVNHGIPENVMDGLLKAGFEFFRLPLEEKELYAIASDGDGHSDFEGYGRRDFDKNYRSWIDNMRHTVRPKPTPEMSRMPARPPTYAPLMEEYTQGVEKLLQVLWATLAEYLGLESTTLKKAQEDDSLLYIRLNYYPKCPEPEKTVGISGHKDFGSLTVLLQDEVGGLQVQKPGTVVWVDVKPKKGSLVINIANQVEILSNGRYKSSVHRALVNRNKPRISIAAFASPGPNCIIRPVQELLEKTQQPPRYKHLVFGDYVPNLKADLKAGVRPHLRYELNRN